MPFSLRTMLLRAAALALAASLAGAAGTPIFAAENPPPAGPQKLNLTAADPLVVDGQTREVIARNGARLEYGEWALTADEIRYNQGTGEAVATGHVVATRPGWRLLGEVVRYRLAAREVDVTDFRFGRPPFHMAGRRAHGTAEEMVFEDVEIVYGEPGLLAPRGSARELRLYGDDRMEGKRLRLGLGALPPIGFSAIARPTEVPRFYWESRAGFDSNLGAHAGVNLYLPTSTGIAPGGGVDVFTQRGLLFGPGVRYDFTRGGIDARGEADFAFIRDTGDREEDALGRPIDADRYFGRWKHRLRSGDRWTLNGELNWWSDSAVYRDFRESRFRREQEPDNFLEASLNGTNTIVSAFVRARPNDFQVAPERLPEIRFDLLPTPVAGTGALLELESSAAILREEPPAGGPTLRSNRVDVYAALGRTVRLARGVTATPVVGGRFTHYDRTLTDEDSYTRWLGEIGFDARLHAQRVYELKKPMWGIDGLRHVVEPRLEYRYIPSADKGRGAIPAIDRPAFLTQLQPLGLAGRRDLDALEEVHAVRLGLGNIVETRRHDYGSRQLARLDLAADIYLNKRDDSRDLSDLHAEFQLTPVDWLEWWVYVRADPEDPALEELNTRLMLVNGDAWSFGLGTDYLRHEIEQIELLGRYALSEAHEVYAETRYDSRERRFNEVAFGLRTRLSQTWLLGSGVTFRDGPRRESGFSFRLDLRFLAF